MIDVEITDDTDVGVDVGEPSAVMFTIHFKGDIRRIYQASERLKELRDELPEAQRPILDKVVKLINMPEANHFLQLDLPMDCHRAVKAKGTLAALVGLNEGELKDELEACLMDLR